MQGLREIDLESANYMKTLEVAVQHGLPVLLKNVHETLDASLDPILNKAIIKIGLCGSGDSHCHTSPYDHEVLSKSIQAEMLQNFTFRSKTHIFSLLVLFGRKDLQRASSCVLTLLISISA